MSRPEVDGSMLELIISLVLVRVVIKFMHA